MSEKLVIEKVNRHESDWDPKTMFTGFMIRAVLKEQPDMITKINAKSSLHRRLKREIGEEGEDWILQTNDRTGEDELYLKNSGKLVMWKLQNVEKFNGLFERVEQHRDNLNEVREDE